MSATTVKLLQAAREVVGGTGALAGRLGISETLLSKFMDDMIELPDRLLLQVADIVLAEREARLAQLAVQRDAQSPPEPALDH